MMVSRLLAQGLAIGILPSEGWPFLLCEEWREAARGGDSSEAAEDEGRGPLLPHGDDWGLRRALMLVRDTPFLLNIYLNGESGEPFAQVSMEPMDVVNGYCGWFITVLCLGGGWSDV